MQDSINTWPRRFELYSRSVRHSEALRRADMLWNIARPCYNRALALVGRQGLERNINGTDLIRVHARCRGVQEKYEPEVWSHLLDSLHSGDCVVDVGAHIGLYSIAMAKRIRPDGKVYACEPDASNRRLLIENVRLNELERRVVCLPIAISSSDGLAGFVENSNNESHIAFGDQNAPSEVPCFRLDTLFRTSRVDILKIDVEGFEEHVLRGAVELLSHAALRPRLICLEVHPYAWHSAGTESDAVFKFLSEVHYRLFTVSGEPITAIENYGHVFAYPA